MSRKWIKDQVLTEQKWVVHKLNRLCPMIRDGKEGPISKAPVFMGLRDNSVKKDPQAKT